MDEDTLQGSLAFLRAPRRSRIPCAATAPRKAVQKAELAPVPAGAGVRGPVARHRHAAPAQAVHRARLGRRDPRQHSRRRAGGQGGKQKQEREDMRRLATPASGRPGF